MELNSGILYVEKDLSTIKVSLKTFNATVIVEYRTNKFEGTNIIQGKVDTCQSNIGGK